MDDSPPTPPPSPHVIFVYQCTTNMWFCVCVCVGVCVCIRGHYYPDERILNNGKDVCRKLSAKQKYQCVKGESKVGGGSGLRATS